jgi:hypothetical protein
MFAIDPSRTLDDAPSSEVRRRNACVTGPLKHHPPQREDMLRNGKDDLRVLFPWDKTGYVDPMLSNDGLFPVGYAVVLQDRANDIYLFR